MRAVPVNTVNPDDLEWMTNKSSRKQCLDMSFRLFAIEGEKFYGYMGGAVTDLLSDVHYVWFAAPPGATISRAELRRAKKNIKLTEVFPGRIVADVEAGDKVAGAFARFFGLVKTGHRDGYDIYEGAN